MGLLRATIVDKESRFGGALNRWKRAEEMKLEKWVKKVVVNSVFLGSIGCEGANASEVALLPLPQINAPATFVGPERLPAQSCSQ